MTVLPGSAELALLLVQLVAIVAVVDAARRLVDAYGPQLDAGDRLVAIGTVAGAGLVVIVQLLGFTGVLSPANLGATLSVAWFAAWFASRRMTRSRTEPRRSGARLEPPTLVVLAAAGLVLVPVLLDALLVVPTEWDGLTYHLLYPARFLQDGRIEPVEFGQPLDQAALYPANGELLHAFVMAFVRSDLLVALGMVGWAVLYGLAIARLTRALGASQAAAAVAGALAATVPALAARAPSSYVEPLLDFGLAAAVLFLRRAFDAGGVAIFRWSTLAGLAAGLAVGTKYVALPLVVALAVALPVGLVLAGAGRRRAVGAGALFLLAVVAVGGAWYLRNALLVGNPVYPAPLAGLPHLERPGLVWQGSSVAERLPELVGDGSLTAALFALPPRGAVWMTLGPLALGAGLLALLACGRTAREAVRSWEAADRFRALSVLVVPSALFALAATWARLPFWDNPGLFRSEVRFAVPAVGLAFALAMVFLERAGVSSRGLAALGACGVLGQGLLAGVLGATQELARGAVLVLPPLAIAALLVAIRRRGAVSEIVLRGAASMLVVLALFVAWGYREVALPRAWLAPGATFRPFTEAALALEHATPGARTAAFASSSHFEFLYPFHGRRLERRVLGVPVHDGPRQAFRYREGDARRTFDRELWRRELELAGAEVLIVSRWQAWRELWPPEHDWAIELGFEEVYRSTTVAAFRVADPGGSALRLPADAQESQGGPRPDSRQRAR